MVRITFRLPSMSSGSQEFLYVFFNELSFDVFFFFSKVHVVLQDQSSLDVLAASALPNRPLEMLKIY